MSDLFTRVRDEVNTWSAPAKDLPTVVEGGRRRTFIRRASFATLCLAVLAGSLAATRLWDRDDAILPPVGSSFDLVHAVAELNGVTLERATPDESWEFTRDQAFRGERTLLPDGPIPVLVTSSRLGRGMEDIPAWATLIDGWQPGLPGEDPSRDPQVYLVLQFTHTSSHIPAAPPYEWWSFEERPTEATYEPLPTTTKLEWEGVAVEHPINWARLTEDYDPGGSVTRLASITITNMSSLPPGFGAQNRSDMQEAPPDAVVVQLSALEGGPESQDCSRDDAQSCEGIEVPGIDTVDYAGNRHGYFSIGNVQISYWVGRDASDAETAAFERIRDSVSADEDKGSRQGDTGNHQDGFALWPGDDPERAQEDCTAGESDGPFTSDPSSIALEFGSQKLSWDGAIAIDLGTSGGQRELELRRDADDDGQEADGAAVRVWVREVQQDCWFVTSVSRPPDHQPTGVGISVSEREFSIGFDPLGASEVRGEIYYGEMGTNLRWVGGDTVFKGKLGTPPQSPGHFLLLFLDNAGEVFSATGGPLPVGDVTAG